MIIWFISLIALICMVGKIVWFFFSTKMLIDLIFKNNTDLKKEYLKMANDLPLLNECGYCEKLKGRYCLNFSVNCGVCIRERCRNCYNFNR